jgi:hypothetical protein
MLVHIPFLDYNDSADHVVVLKKILCKFVANGDREVNISEDAAFRFPLLNTGKVPGFTLRRKGLFSAISQGASQGLP